jgi:outer membrane protein TolC
MFLILLLVCPGAGSAADEQPEYPRSLPLKLNLTDAIALALRNNRSLIDARLGRTLDKLALEASEDEFWPKVNVTPSTKFLSQAGEYRRDSADAAVSSGVTLRIPTGGQINLDWENSVADQFHTALRFSFSQPLLKGGGIKVGTASLRIARRMEEMSVLGFKSVIINIVSSVIRSYRNFIQARQRLEISIRSLQRGKDLLAVNRLLIQTGRMAERDIVQAEAEVANRELRLTETRNSLDAARLALVDILDIDSGARIEPTETLTIEAKNPDVDRSRELALQHRPEYLQALLRIENAEIALLVAKNNRLWDLSLTSSVDFSGSDSIGAAFPDSGDYRIGLNLAIPLVDRAPRRDYLSARLRLERARRDLEELRQKVDIIVVNAVREVDVRFQQVELAQRARELAEQKLDIEQEKLKLGLSTNFQLVRFEDDLVDAQNGEVDAVIAYLNALTSLDQTLGTTLDTWEIDVREMEE